MDQPDDETPSAMLGAFTGSDGKHGMQPSREKRASGTKLALAMAKSGYRAKLTKRPAPSLPILPPFREPSE